MRIIIKLATHVVAVSEAARRNAVRHLKVTPERIHVILNAMPDPGPLGEGPREAVISLLGG